MSVKELLPIGSVVLLKEGEKRLMIVGILQNEPGKDDVIYDYLGYLYPEGHIGGAYQYLFNNEDIEKLYFRGYEDDERNQFLEALSARYEE